MTTVEDAQISEFIADDLNANKGTRRGREMLAQSVRNYGAGRSILVDKSGRIIAGNKTVEAAKEVGLKNAIVVKSTGDQLVVVQRTDIDLDSSEGRALALADNRTGEVNLEWDPEVLRQLQEQDQNLLEHFADTELTNLIGHLQEVDDPTAEWIGMPEFVQSDLTPVRQIIVSFDSEEDCQKFAKLVGQKITEKTKSLWYPFKANGSQVSHVYVDDE